jgi:hypothetical protein
VNVARISARVGTAATIAALLSLVTSGSARGESADERAPATNFVDAATQAGNFLPLTLPASVVRASASGAAYGGYDSAAQNARVVSFAEARIYGPFALRIGAQSSGASERIAPSVTGRLQFVSEPKHGVDAALALAYNAEGFTELEGELEVLLAVGKTFGNLRLLGNLAYGQDVEGEERDGELRAAALYHLGSVYYLGLDARGRIDLGSETATLGTQQESEYDLDIGPVLNLALGPVVVGMHGGVSALQRPGGDTRWGAVVLAGLGTAL